MSFFEECFRWMNFVGKYGGIGFIFVVEFFCLFFYNFVYFFIVFEKEKSKGKGFGRSY